MLGNELWVWLVSDDFTGHQIMYSHQKKRPWPYTLTNTLYIYIFMFFSIFMIMYYIFNIQYILYTI